MSFWGYMKKLPIKNNLISSAFINVSLIWMFLVLYIILEPNYNDTKIQSPFLFWFIITSPSIITFITLEIIGIIRIFKWKTDSKYKVLLLSTWILFNLAYLISFYVLYSLNKINEWNIDKNISIKRIEQYSIVLFSFLLLVFIIRILLTKLTIFQSNITNNNIAFLENFLFWLQLISFVILLCFWLLSIFYGINLLKLNNQNKFKLLLSIAIISFIPIVNSINWILTLIYKKKFREIDSEY